jgi:hypothetical protein
MRDLISRIILYLSLLEVIFKGACIISNGLICVVPSKFPRVINDFIVRNYPVSGFCLSFGTVNAVKRLLGRKLGLFPFSGEAKETPHLNHWTSLRNPIE